MDRGASEARVVPDEPTGRKLARDSSDLGAHIGRKTLQAAGEFSSMTESTPMTDHVQQERWVQDSSFT